jgi:hypothetical protein
MSFRPDPQQAAMSDTPPFDPPYKTCTTIDGAERWFEVRQDGTQVETAAPVVVFSSPAPAQASGAKPRSGGGKVFLNVPYAEKDAAKSLGARWDAAKRKWYIPTGLDKELFSKWVLD